MPKVAFWQFSRLVLLGRHLILIITVGFFLFFLAANKNVLPQINEIKSTCLHVWCNCFLKGIIQYQAFSRKE
jgi:hypothetical protein